MEPALRSSGLLQFNFQGVNYTLFEVKNSDGYGIEQ